MKSITHTFKKNLATILYKSGFITYYQKFRRRPYQGTPRFTTTVDGVTVQFRTDDEYSNEWFFPRYAGGGIHEKVVTEFLVEELHKAKCFVDVGTNLGWYTCIASRHMPHGTVYGFEMDNLNFALLENNLALNDCSNVEVHNMAVSDSSGVVSYRRDVELPNSVFQLQINGNNENSSGIISVSSIALDDFFQEKEVTPDVIKIDVEGAEMRVLKGMERILRQCMPILFLEIHPNELHRFNTSVSAILLLLIEANYNVFEIEKMRNQKAKKNMKPLQQNSKIGKTSMLYARIASE